MTCQSIREDAAAALLTGEPLDPAVVEHLDTCAECRKEIDDLRPVVDLLVLAPPLPTTQNPGDLLLRRLITKAAQERRRHQIRLGVVAAVLALVLLPGLAWLALSGGSPNPAGVVASTSLNAHATNASSGVRGAAHLQPAAGGSALTLSVHGVDPGTHCALVVVDANGARSVVDRWTADYQGRASIATQTTLPMSQISHVELVDTADSHVLLHLEFA